MIVMGIMTLKITVRPTLTIMIIMKIMTIREVMTKIMIIKIILDGLDDADVATYW